MGARRNPIHCYYNKGIAYFLCAGVRVVEIDQDSNPTDPVIRAIAELGEPTAIYSVNWNRFIVKVLFGLVILAAAALSNFLWWTVGPARVDTIGMFLMLGPPLWALSIFRHIYRTFGLQVMTYPTGLLSLHRGEARAIPYHEIAHYYLRTATASTELLRNDQGEVCGALLNVDPPYIKFWEASITLTLKRPQVQAEKVEPNSDEDEFEDEEAEEIPFEESLDEEPVEVAFTPAVNNYPELCREIQAGLTTAYWDDLRRAIEDGSLVQFGRIIVGAQKLYYEDSELDYKEVAEISMSSLAVRVNRKGKWLTWALQEIGDVPNPHLFFALAIFCWERATAEKADDMPLDDPKKLEPARSLEEEY